MTAATTMKNLYMLLSRSINLSSMIYSKPFAFQKTSLKLLFKATRRNILDSGTKGTFYRSRESRLLHIFQKKIILFTATMLLNFLM